ncbi:MAG: EAL domain-containing protein [Pseudomonadota bacterium]
MRTRSLDDGASNQPSAEIGQRDRDVLDMVAEAIQAKSIHLAFQPVVLANDTRRLAFFESLIRIRDPGGRTIPAKDFMENVEHCELGRLIDCLSLAAGLRALAQHPTLRLAINMSALSVGYPDWLETLDTGIGQAPDISERLIIEITEHSVIAEPESVGAFMQELHSLGICFAMDDFGAGQTSLRHLRDLEFDVLKIDGAFTKGIHGDPDNQALTSALHEIGRHFGMLTVAENVEAAADAAWLADAGIDCLQGFYFGAPSLSPDWSDSSNLGATG